MITLSPVIFVLLGFVLAAVSALATIAVAWGAFRTQLERQREEIGDLRGDVRALQTTVHDLTMRLGIVADRQSREPSAPTPVHGIPLGIPLGAPPRRNT